MKKIFTTIIIISLFWSCSNLKQSNNKPCINKISYLEEKVIHPTILPPAIKFEIKDYKKIIANKIKCKYAIIIGLKPKANLLIAGTVEPNCNRNFALKAKLINKIRYFK